MGRVEALIRPGDTMYLSRSAVMRGGPLEGTSGTHSAEKPKSLLSQLKNHATTSPFFAFKLRERQSFAEIVAVVNPKAGSAPVRIPLNSTLCTGMQSGDVGHEQHVPPYSGGRLEGSIAACNSFW
jgi:hypothetical protein